MLPVQEDLVGDYLAGVMDLVVRASPGPFRIEPAAGGRYALRTETGRAVATVNREDDAKVFARDRLDLRVLVTAVAELLGWHYDDGTGHCAKDGEPVPCTTRRLFDAELSPRAASS